MKYTDDQIKQANECDVVSFAQSVGMTCERAGKEIHIRGYGGLFVDPERNMFSCFSMSGSDGRVLGGKGALSFATKILGYDFKSAMRLIVGNAEEIRQFSPGRKCNPDESKKEFTLPPRSDINKNLVAYLVKTRCISPDIVNEFIQKGLLYQTNTVINGKNHANGVFLHRNSEGKPCGAQIFGLSSFARFKQNIFSDDTDRGFVYEKGSNSKTVYLFESAIDLMSFVQLHPGITNAKFVSMGGLKPTTAAHYINDGSLKVVSCVDNDSEGQAFNRSVCVKKTENSLSEKNAKRIKSSGDPPIEFFSAERDGGKCCYFMSEEDYLSVKATDSETLKGAAVFVRKNTGSFEINRECAAAGVKDFNGLLQLMRDKAETLDNCNRMIVRLDNVLNNCRDQRQKNNYR